MRRVRAHHARAGRNRQSGTGTATAAEARSPPRHTHSRYIQNDSSSIKRCVNSLGENPVMRLTSRLRCAFRPDEGLPFAQRSAAVGLDTPLDLARAAGMPPFARLQGESLDPTAPRIAERRQRRRGPKRLPARREMAFDCRQHVGIAVRADQRIEQRVPVGAEARASVEHAVVDIRQRDVEQRSRRIGGEADHADPSARRRPGHGGCRMAARQRCSGTEGAPPRPAGRAFDEAHVEIPIPRHAHERRGRKMREPLRVAQREPARVVQHDRDHRALKGRRCGVQPSVR